MKNLLLFCVAMATIATQLFSQNEQSNYENTLLWKIEGNDLKAPSYLYGTIHVGDARVFQYGNSLKAAIKEVDALYGEIDLTDFTAQMAAMSRMMMDKNLSDLVTEEEYTQIMEQAKGNPVAMMINRLKPFFTLAELTRVLIPSDSTTVLDLHLQQLAQSLGKEVGGVETINEQLDAVDKISLENQAEMLVEFCVEFEEQKAELKKLIDLYLAHDLNGLLKLSEEGMAEGDAGKEFELGLLIDRNIVMVKRLKKLMAEKSLVFAVGALHLPGENGLIDLLRAEGYTVTGVM